MARGLSSKVVRVGDLAVSIANLGMPEDEYFPKWLNRSSLNPFVYFCARGSTHNEASNLRSWYRGPLKWDIQAPYFAGRAADQPLWGYALESDTRTFCFFSINEPLDGFQDGRKQIWRSASNGQVFETTTYHNRHDRASGVSVREKDRFKQKVPRVFFEPSDAMNRLQQLVHKELPKFNPVADPIHGLLATGRQPSPVPNPGKRKDMARLRRQGQTGLRGRPKLTKEQRDRRND